MRMRGWRSFDLLLLVATIAIIATGIALIYSATISTEVSDELLERSFFRQMMFGASGLLILFLVSAIDYHLLESVDWVVYLVAVGILGLGRIESRKFLPGPNCAAGSISQLLGYAWMGHFTTTPCLVLDSSNHLSPGGRGVDHAAY